MKVSQQPQKPLSGSNQIWATTSSKKDTATSEVTLWRPVPAGGPEGQVPLPLFGSSVNPISTRGGGTLSPPSTMCPPRFSDLATALLIYIWSRFCITIFTFRDRCKFCSKRGFPFLFTMIPKVPSFHAEAVLTLLFLFCSDSLLPCYVFVLSLQRFHINKTHHQQCNRQTGQFPGSL